jgi:biopolymer transport protein ExbD
VTASFSLQKTIEVPPPKQDQKGAAQSLTIEDLQANTIFVKIDERNAIFIDDVPAGNPAELADALTKARLTTLRTELAIDAHNETLHETVVLVIDAATEAGMQKIRIVSRTAGSE